MLSEGPLCACETCIDAANQSVCLPGTSSEMSCKTVATAGRSLTRDATMQAVVSGLMADKEADKDEAAALAASLADTLAELTASQTEVVSLREARSANLTQVQSGLQFARDVMSWCSASSLSSETQHAAFAFADLRLWPTLSPVSCCLRLSPQTRASCNSRVCVRSSLCASMLHMLR